LRRQSPIFNPFLNLKNILSRFKPSGEGQEAPDDPGVTTMDIPENILAFRSITTLIHVSGEQDYVSGLDQSSSLA
jgi:hypothetical protein